MSSDPNMSEEENSVGYVFNVIGYVGLAIAFWPVTLTLLIAWFLCGTEAMHEFFVTTLAYIIIAVVLAVVAGIIFICVALYLN